MKIHARKFTFLFTLFSIALLTACSSSKEVSDYDAQFKRDMAREGIMPERRVLVVLTNHSEYPSEDEKTGLWLTELTHFYSVLYDAGYVMDFVSPSGGKVPLDERSLGWLYTDSESNKMLKNQYFQERLENTKSPAEVNAEDYSAIYYAGGHGTMWDFPESEGLQRLSREIYENGGFVSAVCHGPAGLLNIKLSDGNYLIANKTVTGYTNFEEVVSGVKDQVPYLLEDEMVNRGAKFESSFFPFTSHVVQDGRLITGQNPQSTTEIAEKLVKALENR